jgi:hypothetical protein
LNGICVIVKSSQYLVTVKSWNHKYQSLQTDQHLKENEKKKDKAFDLKL